MAEKQDVLGLVVATHCGVATEMVRAAELIVGPLAACRALSLDPGDSVERLTATLAEAVREVDQGRGVIILTDLFGGTPANISLALMGPKVEVLSGVNLPMLIKFASCRGELTLPEAAAALREYGRRHISLASEVLSGRAAKTP